MTQPKRALITGASSGIGESLAKLLASQRVNLVLVARRLERLEKLAQELRSSYGVDIDVLSMDLTLPEASEKIYAFATQNRKEVDVLINNAGSGPYRLFLDTSLAEYQQTLSLNVVSLTSLCHLFGQHMRKHARPSFILNVASVAAYQQVPRFAVYCSSKTYVKNLSQILHYEFRKSNISVSCLCPGGTDTEFPLTNNQNVKGGKTFLMSSDKVAEIAWSGLLRKKMVIVPGIFNKLSCLFPSLLPSSLGMKVAEMAMTTAVKEIK